MAIRILNAKDVRALLPMADCIDAMHDAMVALSRGDVTMPPRIIAALADQSGFMAAMPGSGLSPPIDGAKLLTLLPSNPGKGMPAIQGVVLLFDHATGAPAGLVDGAEITALRTAAVSGLATRLLARADARSHGILGTGVQAGVHIDAIASARPKATDIRVWGRDHARAQAFAAEQRARTGLAIRAVSEPADAAACDIVSTTTASATPVLLGEWLNEGAHINLVGAHRPMDREADTTTILRSAVYVDVMRSAQNEAGDLLLPISEGRFSWERVVGELGQLAAGGIPGRQADSQITLFKSLGVVAQDLFAAWVTLERAQHQGCGVLAPF
jgi:ornithine cyclodeaminase